MSTWSLISKQKKCKVHLWNALNSHLLHFKYKCSRGDYFIKWCFFMAKNSISDQDKWSGRKTCLCKASQVPREGLLRRGIIFFLYLTKSSQISSKSLLSAPPHRPTYMNLISQNFQFPSGISETVKSCFYHTDKATSPFYIRKWIHTKQRRGRNQWKHKPLSGCGKILGSQ